MKRHTEEKKHECEHCGKRFFTRYHLRLHQTKIHSKVEQAQTKTEHKDVTALQASSGTDLAQLIDDDSTMIVFE